MSLQKYWFLLNQNVHTCTCTCIWRFFLNKKICKLYRICMPKKHKHVSSRQYVSYLYKWYSKEKSLTLYNILNIYKHFNPSTFSGLQILNLPSLLYTFIHMYMNIKEPIHSSYTYTQQMTSNYNFKRNSCELLNWFWNFNKNLFNE